MNRRDVSNAEVIRHAVINELTNSGPTRVSLLKRNIESDVRAILRDGSFRFRADLFISSLVCENSGLRITGDLVSLNGKGR